MEIVDHPGLGHDAGNGIGGRAVQRHTVVKGDAGNAAALRLLAKR
jgi:hypothetical protein